MYISTYFLCQCISHVNVNDFNNRNENAIKHLPNFTTRHFEMIKNISLKKLLQQGISNSDFFGDLVYKFKKTVGNPNFSDLFKRIVNSSRRAGYALDIMRQTACLVFNQIMVEGYTTLFSCTAVVTQALE